MAHGVYRPIRFKSACFWFSRIAPLNDQQVSVILEPMLLVGSWDIVAVLNFWRREWSPGSRSFKQCSQLLIAIDNDIDIN